MDIREFLQKDQFATLLGIELIEAQEGQAKSRILICDKHLNAIQIAQGGVVFTLADFTLAAASNAYGNVAVALNATITFHKAAQKGWLFAEATELSRNNKIATYLVKVTDASGELIASFQGIVYRKKEKTGS